MTSYQSALRRAMANHFEMSVAQERDRAGTVSKLRQAQAQVRKESEAFVELLRQVGVEGLARAKLTNFQERFMATVEGTDARVRDFLEAVNAADRDEEALDAAAGRLIGGIVGHVIALESRLAAIEMALGN